MRTTCEAVNELGSDDDSAPFQYVITTTTDPPEGLADRVRLTLGTEPVTDRLLQVDM